MPVMQPSPEVFPATAAGVRAAVSAPAATVGDAPDLLDVDVDQFAGSIALVAHRVAGGPVQVVQPRPAVAGQYRIHRGGGHAQPPGQLMRAQLAGRALGHDLALAGAAGAPRRAVRPVRAVVQPRPAFGAVAPQPPVGTRARHALHVGRARRRIALLDDAAHHQLPSVHRQPTPRAATVRHESLLAARRFPACEQGGSHLVHHVPGKHN